MNEPKEIDFSTIGKGLNKYLLKNKKIIGVLLIMGLAAGILHYYLVKPLYSSNLTARSTVISNLRVKNIFESIDLKLREKDFQYVSEKFNISVESASKLESLSVEPIEDKDSYFDNHNSPRYEGNVFVIEVEMNDFNVCGDLTLGVEHFMNNHPYLLSEVAKKQKVFEDLIQSIETDIKTINKSIEESKEGNSSGLYIVNKSDDIVGRLGMRKELMTIKKQLIDNTPVEIISEFVPFVKRVNSLGKSILIAASLFLFGGILVKEIALFFTEKKD